MFRLMFHSCSNGTRHVYDRNVQTCEHGYISSYKYISIQIDIDIPICSSTRTCRAKTEVGSIISVDISGDFTPVTLKDTFTL